MADVSLQSIFDQARRALDGGDADRAIGIARHILQHAPEVIDGHRLLGEAYLNAGQSEQAVAAFEHVLRADPEHIAAFYGLGLAEQHRDRRVEAIRAFERALEIQPNLPELRTQLLRLYAETPGSAGQFRLSRSGLGRLYARGQMYSQAIDEFRAVLDNEPERDDVRVALAEVLWRDGQEDEAAEFCSDTVRQRPELHKPTLILGYLQLAAGRPEGEILWRQAARQDPNFQTAQALFDVLPPVQIEEIQIPAFDEQAWREEQRRNAEEEEQRIAEEERQRAADEQRVAEEQRQRAAEEQTRIAAEEQRSAAEVVAPLEPVAVTNDDDFFGDSWLGQTTLDPPITPAEPEEQVPPASSTDQLSDDDLLASLLGLDDGTRDLSDLEAVTPFSLDEPQQAAPPAAPNEMAVADTEVTPAAGVEQPAPAEDEKPSAPDDWSVDESDHASSDASSAGAAFELTQPDAQPDSVQPFQLDTFDDDAQPFSFDTQPADVAERRSVGAVEPFSLEDWNLEGDDDLPRGPAVTERDNQPEPSADDIEGLTPFSLDELSLDALAEDRSDFLAGPPEQATDTGREKAEFDWEEPFWARPETGGAFTDSGEESIFAKLVRERQTEIQPTDDAMVDDASFFSMDDVDLRGAAEEPSAAADEPDVAPFSLRDLGVADSEIDTVQAPSGAQARGTGTDEEDTTPFSLRDLGIAESEAPPQGQNLTAPEDVQPFSLADLGDEWTLEPEQTGAGKAAAPFALDADEQPAASQPRTEPGGDVDDWPEARPVAAPAEQHDSADGIQPFSFADLGLDEAELETSPVDESLPSAVMPQARPPELTPFSLAELGLREEDFANNEVEPSSAGGTAQRDTNAAVSTAAAAGGDEPSVPDEPDAALAATDDETTPFSLADLGLSDSELAELGVDMGPDATVPGGAGFSAPEDEETTPFSLADLGLSDEELELFGVADEQAYAEEAAPEAGMTREPSSGPTLPPFPELEHERQPQGTEGMDGEGDADLAPFAAVDMVEQQEQAQEIRPDVPAQARPEVARTAAQQQPQAEPPAELRRFYEQLELKPDNHAMRLALARMNEGRGDVERALDQYKQLINRGQLIEPVVEDLQELSGGAYDRRLLRRIHRLLGDAYMKQDRYHEAMDEYSWT